MFVNDFLTRMQPFSTLRFMDALNTNDNNTLKNWSQRSWPSAAAAPSPCKEWRTRTSSRSPTKPAWTSDQRADAGQRRLRLPVGAAVSLRRTRRHQQHDLQPSAPAGTATTSPINGTSKIYVEYSNEIWNWGFHQVLDTYCMGVWRARPDHLRRGVQRDGTG